MSQGNFNACSWRPPLSDDDLQGFALVRDWISSMDRERVLIDTSILIDHLRRGNKNSTVYSRCPAL